MLSVKKNEDGYIVAYAEYRVVNKDAQDDKDGIYAYIKDCWIHPNYRKTTIRELIKQGHQRYPKLRYIYYKRKKYKGRMKMLPIERAYEI